MKKEIHFEKFLKILILFINILNINYFKFQN